MTKETEIKVSVIVPVWNAGDKIRRCLDSLLEQSMRDIEVICVLDCPTDGTDKIVDEYSARDSRVIVLRNEKNLHVSGSRNRGLAVARGEYIGFSDHDDYREDMSMYEVLYNKAIADEADIVVSGAKVIFEDRHCEDWHFSDCSRHGLVSANILPFSHTVNPQIITHCVWHSIYRKKMLQQNNICFKDRAVYADEDRLFNFEAYLAADKISCVDQSFYIWDKRGDSVSNTRNYNIAERQITRTQFYVDYLSDKQLLADYLSDIQRLLAVEMRVYFLDYKRLDKHCIKRLKTLWRNTNTSPWCADYGLKVFSRKRLKIYNFWVRNILI